MIAAVCSQGSLHLALTQVNTNSEVFMMYLTWLTRSLDAGDINWRTNSILLLDGATYHMTPETRAHLIQLRVPVMFSGPYSYRIAPCELFFAYLKQGALNPTGLPTRKR